MNGKNDMSFEWVVKQGPIPNREDPERYERAEFVPSSFVELKTGSLWEVKMQYPLMGVRSAERSCLVRKEVSDTLTEAAKLLPAGYRFLIWDAWRPFALQKELFQMYSQKIIREFQLESCSAKEQEKVIRRFVSVPEEDRLVPPVHTTGGAVDITLLDDSGKELEMGTAFDAFAEETSTAFFENVQNAVNGTEGFEEDRTAREKVRDNRRLLYQVMVKAGFTNLPSEWWHYDLGDRFWAYYKQRNAMYKGVFTKEEIIGQQR